MTPLLERDNIIDVDPEELESIINDNVQLYDAVEKFYNSWTYGEFMIYENETGDGFWVDVHIGEDNVDAEEFLYKDYE
jgi:hypothetical protein